MSEYIKKESVMRIIRRCAEDYVTAYYEVENLPSVDVAPVKGGHWMFGGDDISQCSVCGECYSTRFLQPADFCPNCGTNMRKHF